MSCKDSQMGISLVELMVSMALSCLLMSSLLHVFLSGKNHYRVATASLEREFELQQVSELLRDSSRRAGFTPCGGINHLTTQDRRNSENRLAALTWRAGKHQALQLAHMSDDFFVVREIISPTRLRVEGPASFLPNHPVLLADCFYAEVLAVSGSQRSGQDTFITLSKPYRFPFSAPMYLGEWVEERFYMGQTRRGVPALFYDANRAEELTEHVTGLEANIYPLAGSLLLRVNLQVDKGEPILLETRLRTV